MNQLRARKLIKYVGGRWAISIRGCLIYAPLAILFVPIGENAYSDWNQFWRWSSVAILSALPAGGVLLLAHLTYFKDRVFKPRPAYSVVILGLVVGGVRGTSTSLLVKHFGLPDESNWSALSLRALNAGVLAALALPTISLLLLTWDQWQKLRREAIAEYLRTYSDSREQMERSSLREIAILEEFEREVSAKLKSSKYEFEQIAQLSLQSYWLELAANLRSASNDLIRPLSHEISKHSEIAQARGFEQFRNMMRNIRIEPFWATLAFLTSEYRYFVRNMGFQLGNYALAFHALALFLILSIFRRLFRNFKSDFWHVSFFSLLTLSLFFAMYFIQVLIDVPTPLSRTFFEAILGTISVLVIGCISAFRHYQISELATLQNLIKVQEVELHLASRERLIVSQQVSNHLHGSVQSRLMASALAIERAGNMGDLEALRNEVELAYSRISFDVEKVLPKQLSNIDEVHSKVLHDWQGVIDIHFEPHSVDHLIPSSAIKGYEQILGEAIANSFRHGGAMNVSIQVFGGENSLNVVISDDGSGVRSPSGGLGTQLFEVLSRGDWSIQSIDGKGARLVLSIPC